MGFSGLDVGGGNVLVGAGHGLKGIYSESLGVIKVGFNYCCLCGFVLDLGCGCHWDRAGSARHIL